MDWWVYAVKSVQNGRIYVGMSTDISRRIIEHNKKKVRSTKAYTPWVIIFKEFIGDRKKAREKEKYYKSGIGKEILKRKI